MLVGVGGSGKQSLARLGGRQWGKVAAHQENLVAQRWLIFDSKQQFESESLMENFADLCRKVMQ